MVLISGGIYVCIDIDNTVQVDTQRRDKRRDPRKCVEILTASGVGGIKIAAT